MTQEDFKARVSMAYEGREQWEAFLNRVLSIHISELPHWISVADELPPKESEYDDNSIVVLATDGNSVYQGLYQSDEYLSGWFTHDLWALDNITHWMPMPEPPAKLSNVERIGKNLKGGEE